jgi:hypothetical protein
VPGFLLFLATPALTGAAVCGIGRLSDRYGGSCEAPILGAYAGVAALGLGALTVTYARGWFDWHGPVPEWIPVIGYLALPPIGATVAWQLYKRQPGASPLVVPLVAGRF